MPANVTYGTNYPAATIVDGAILLTFFKSGPPNMFPPGAWSTSSTDDGVTWSKAVRMPGSCNAFPAVVLPGTTKTLVAPCSSYAAISTDGGATWRRSKGNITVGTNVTGLGESVLAADGRGPKGDGLSMFIRSGSTLSPLLSHALSQSDDGGETWTAARMLPIIGTTCQGAIGHNPLAPPGHLLLSAPSWPSGGLGGRRNMSLWMLNGSDPAATPVSVMTVFGLGAGYSSFDATGGKTRLLYESGPPHVYDYSISLSHINHTFGL